MDKSAGQIESARSDFDPALQIGQLLTPGTRYSDAGLIYGIDNFAYSNFDEAAWLSLLRRQRADIDASDRCKFVALPDIVGSASRTLELFHHYTANPPAALRATPWALVIQDGIEFTRIPWALLDAIFIGGSTAFKQSAEAVAVIKVAKILKKWVHVGRVNSPLRFEWCEAVGADSTDGNGVNLYSKQRRELNEGAPLLNDLRPVMS